MTAVQVPDLGDAADVTVIEIHVAPGDTVAVDDPIVTLESDKATMDVPSTAAGVVRAVAIATGDVVAEGTVLIEVEEADAAEVPSPGDDDAPAAADDEPVLPEAEEAGAVASAPPEAARVDAAPSARETVRVPDIGDATDVTVIEIHVQPGDTLAAEDPVVTLESDKATMDVPSPAAGAVLAVLVQIGDAVSEGSPLVDLAPAGEVARPAGHAPAPAASEAAPVEAAPAPSADDGVVHASPLARRLARELGVDLRAVAGTARSGRIGKEDVLVAAGAADRAGAAPATPAAAPGEPFAGLAPWPQVDFARFGEIEVVPLSRVKRLVGANLHRNWVRIPHVTHHDEADVTELEAFRVRTNEEQAAAGVKVTMVALLLKASVATLKEHPVFNASLQGDELVLKRYYHLGVAVDTANGLVVPVVRDVDRKGLLELAVELAGLSARAREGKLAPGDMQGATFTISSLGGIGGTGFTPIVNAPEVAILGVTRTATKPVWDGAAFVPRLMLPVSLSYDHRVIDGAAAARFTRTLAGVLEDLRRILL